MSQLSVKFPRGPFPSSPEECLLWEGWATVWDAMASLRIDSTDLQLMVEVGALERASGIGAVDGPHSVVMVRVLDPGKVRAIQKRSWAEQTLELLGAE